MFDYSPFLLEDLDVSIALLLIMFEPGLVLKYFIGNDGVSRPTENTAILNIMREAYLV